jgi:hypothetical protein
MGFNDLLEKAQGLTNSASDAVSKLLDEFNAALPTMKALGFSVEDLQVGMGVLPEVKAKLIADADNVDVKAIDGMIEKKSEQKTLVVVLKGLQAAYNVRGQLGDLGLKGVEIDLTLGIPPKVSIGFMKKVAVSAPTLATA